MGSKISKVLNTVSYTNINTTNEGALRPKRKDIRIADIIPNGSNICSTADIPELGDISRSRLKKVNK